MIGIKNRRALTLALIFGGAGTVTSTLLTYLQLFKCPDSQADLDCRWELALLCVEFSAGTLIIFLGLLYCCCLSNLLSITGFFFTLVAASMRGAYFLAWYFHTSSTYSERIDKFSELSHSLGFWISFSFVFVCLALQSDMKTADYNRSASMGASSRRELQN